MQHKPSEDTVRELGLMHLEAKGHLRSHHIPSPAFTTSLEPKTRQQVNKQKPEESSRKSKGWKNKYIVN